MKFMYGHLIEELVLFLAELAGHKVEGRQDEAEIEGIKGHRDGVVDGVLADVKSASSFSFKKFREGNLKKDDPFGYIPQIQSYLYASKDDPTVQDKDRAAFIVVDKTLGHITMDTHDRDESTNWPEFYRQQKEMVARKEPPERGYELIPWGQSGNMALGFACGYCPFKKQCWPGVRTFLYSNKPVELAVVAREPNVPELKEVEIEDDSDGT